MLLPAWTSPSKSWPCQCLRKDKLFCTYRCGVDYLLSYQCAEVSAVRITLVGLSCIRLPRACLGTNLLHGHCRTYCKLLLRERCSRNLAFVTLQTVKHIHIHFPGGCQRRWRLGSSQGCECKSWIILHTPNLQKCDLLWARISVGVLILNGLQEIQHCCTTLLDRNGASLHLCSAGHEAQAYHFGFHSWIDRYFSYVSRTFVLAFSLHSVLEIPIHVFEFNAFLSKSGAQIRAKILFYAEKQFFSSTVGHWPNRSKTLQIASKLQNSKESKELDPIVGTGTWSKNKQSCPEILQWPSNPQIRLWTK